jgi:hypothetical protein
VQGSGAEVVQRSGGNVNGSPEVAVSPRIGFWCEATPRDIGNPRGRSGVEGSGGPEGSGDPSGGWSVMTHNSEVHKDVADVRSFKNVDSSSMFKRDHQIAVLVICTWVRTFEENIGEHLHDKQSDCAGVCV